MAGVIFDNIYFHNVVELTKTERGYIPYRMPKDVRSAANDGVFNNRYGTGIELRFKMTDGCCDLILSSEYLAEAPVACIYFGSFQGGWEYSTKIIGESATKIHIEYPPYMKKLLEIEKRNKLPFSTEIVRVVLPYTNCYYVGVEGSVEVPQKEEMPATTYLAYGSSITHGSLGLLQPYSYPFLISRKLGCDYINLGYAGCALMEEGIAQYIVSRKDWTFASVEMGVNALSDKRPVSDDEFERRIDRFTQILADDGRKVFATSIFQVNYEDDTRAKKFREIVKKYAQKRLIFTDGLELMGDETFVSADCTHPSHEGLEMVAENWSKDMKKELLEG